MTGMLSWMATDSLGKPGQPRRGGGVALYVREQLECIELCLGVEEEQVDSFLMQVVEEPTRSCWTLY